MNRRQSRAPKPHCIRSQAHPQIWHPVREWGHGWFCYIASNRVRSVGILWSMPERRREQHVRKGSSAIDFLIGKGRLESVSEEGGDKAADRMIHDASKRLRSARSLLDSDSGSAFALAYDAYRMAADSLLARQCLRATGGDGSHRTVEEAVSSQFGDEIPAFSKPNFEQFRQMRNATQYPDFESPEVTDSDAQWAVGLADDAVSGAKGLMSSVGLGPYHAAS